MLGRPMFSQLDRRKADKTVMDQAAHSYNFLLYLAFHPSASTSRLEIYWQEYIVQAFSNHWSKSSSTHRRACDTLAALLWNAHPKIWDERKVSNPDIHLETNDLPRLDPKWVKSRLSIVLPAFETLFKSASWTTDDLGESNIGIAWRNLCKTLADACSKEITPSLDTMQALASLMGMFQRVWKAAPTSLNVSSDHADKVYDIFRFLFTTLASHLGSILFTDRRLLKTSQETYQTATTPTHRHPASTKHLRTPILHFIHMIFSHPPAPPQASFNSLFETILETSVNSRTSTTVQLGIYRQVHELLPDFFQSTHQAHLIHASQVILRSARLVLFSPASQKANEGFQERSDEVLDILSSAMPLGRVPSEWRLTLFKLVNDAKERAGAEAAVPIIDVLSSSAVALLGTDTRSLAIDYCTDLMQESELLCHSFALDRSKDTNTRLRPAAVFKHLHTLINLCLLEVYNNVDSIPVASARELMKGTQNYLANLGIYELPDIFSVLYEGLATYLKDDRLILEEEKARPAVGSIRNMTAKTSQLLWRVLENDPSQLHPLSPMIVGGLLSSSQATVDYFVSMWNKIFGYLSAPRCPESITKALSTLKPRIDTKAPTLPGESESESEDSHLSSRSIKAQKITQSRSNSKSKPNSRRAASTVVAGVADRHPSTPEAERFHEEDSTNYVAANTPREDSQNDMNILKKPEREPLRGVFAPFRRSETPGDIHLWDSTVLSPGAGNDSDAPTSSPTPGSKGNQSQQSLLTQESVLDQSRPYALLNTSLPPRAAHNLPQFNNGDGVSPEKQVSQTEVVEETVLLGDTDLPDAVQVEDTVMASPPQERSVDNAIIYEPPSPEEPTGYNETLKPSQSISQRSPIRPTDTTRQPKVPDEDLVASQLTVDLQMSMGLDTQVHPDMASTAQNLQKRKRMVPQDHGAQSDSSSDSQHLSRSRRRKKNRKIPLDREFERHIQEAMAQSAETTPSRMTRSSSQKLKGKQETVSAQTARSKGTTQSKKQRKSITSGSRRGANKKSDLGDIKNTEQDDDDETMAGVEDSQSPSQTGTSGEPSNSPSPDVVGQLKAVLENVQSSEFDVTKANTIDETLIRIMAAVHKAVERHQKHPT
ncbi:hypothetical protein KEM56_003666 [Ascosphaera pollenicola]|nr:hypothetical protein KEM56_003666 [Ascosphaera pollenicola]